MKSKLDYIAELSFFKSLTKEQLLTLAEISNISSYPKNSILYYENDTSNKLFFLASGILKIYKIDKFSNEIFLYHIYANSLISELTTLESESIYCVSNAEFLEDSIILEINFTEFKNLFLSKNILNNEFINEILLKNHQLHCVVNRELVFDATAKVAFMLNDDLSIFNQLKRQEVSFMLHIQPETLSRVLKRLKRSDIIDIENGNVVILDKPALQAIYKGE
ncbi:MAG: Crp/Fnr family transcriptional regulator [Sulfurimonas sp.]|jgi:CRP-like cAMP-binding protein|nr:Crp/Fnr family transcriptional regulator [Sulfurimonas sp.]MBU4023733.1 Crp/Fnr family transcriptional regulator [bacterium]MBU4058957.1 Crp/Fnr family transcriptional regulator [bacterium]MBU4110090.1 Crp/Fnr family transcriptional regulator [bacterium]